MSETFDALSKRIVQAAIQRHDAQRRLEEGEHHGDPAHFMRQRLRAVNQADRKITAAAAEIFRRFPGDAGSVLASAIVESVA